ncbi:flavodoxin [Caldalkalibacillus thermarum TA2.A1]|uniref:Flavodoxin n=1 Tax=Caldalkalibacillus thermarum (strain TA2.A1) TaxID=986075 RepID=A0A8X8I6F1_CALTT|nr:flavodoxin [Caldalkalibacillus thermarum]QZT32458.1 flavodoxin [Caldalkalibacillus thermarum TA2.A1]
MYRVVIIYASMTGNTEAIAMEIARCITNEAQNIQVETKEMEGLDAQVVLDYDGILLGSYTWGDGELPFEAEDFCDGLANLDLSGKVVACFGSGDHAYPQFCAAVDLLQKQVEECGACVLPNGLKIELEPDEEDWEQCREFARLFIQLLFQEGVDKWAG